ncbi:MAG: DNA mismatch repair endonuclease MutL, partial [Syntrophobacterales bacterium]|nr:DNA mismatch repair endonuclease MutL [Syntrophobacterales bacterium]
MTTIAVLSEDVANQIAAGEVVERPASILKELLENALDAGATDLVIELEQGGCRAIRLTDNGAGLSREEMALAFRRHATSKIQAIDDIYNITTYGFRGEALPSIASIAAIEMTSRKKGSLAGHRLLMEGGKTESLTEIGCPEGTSIRVFNIFDRIPARKKFLKTAGTEQSVCMDVLIRMALSRLDVRIKVFANNREILYVPQTSNLVERLSILLDEDAAAAMIPVRGENEGVRITGFITQPDYSRANAKGYYLFVNGRFIRDPLINHAVMTACRRVLPEKRYPALILFISLSPGDVDVNVHPAKTEIRFRNPQDIYKGVVEAIAASLSPSFSNFSASVEQEDEQKKDENVYQHRVAEALKRYNLITGAKKPVFAGREGGLQRPAKENPSFWEPSLGREPHVRDLSPLAAGNESPAGALFSSSSASKEPSLSASAPAFSFAGLAYWGQIGASYLVFSGDDFLLIMDQHAAHERILFEKLRQAAREKKDFTQPLLVPEVVSLSPVEYDQFYQSIPLLGELGLEME